MENSYIPYQVNFPLFVDRDEATGVITLEYAGRKRHKKGVLLQSQLNTSIIEIELELAELN